MNRRHRRWLRSLPRPKPVDIGQLRDELRPALERIAVSPGRLEPQAAIELHQELLAAFGRGIGLGFDAQPPEEPPSNEWSSVLGRFDPLARAREFGVILEREELEEGGEGLVASIIELFLPQHACGVGAGTLLIESLLALWSRLGVAEVRASATGDGSCAFAAWGFQLAHSDNFNPPQEVRAQLLDRAGLGSPASTTGVPPELAEQLGRLLNTDSDATPLLDMPAIYRLESDGSRRFGAELLHGVHWPARLRLSSLAEGASGSRRTAETRPGV